MSGPLAIAAVTAALKDLLNDGLLNHDLSTVGNINVTTLPPDRITTGAQEPNQLNLFLYQVTSNSGWRNTDLPSLNDKGTTRLRNPPLAIDLHYLLTAYGSKDMNAEILLGYAMQLLHETPVLTREKLRLVLGGVALVDGSFLPGPFGSLSAVDLADQAELIKITPLFMNSEELSKLWTAMQARYRPTMAYMASVVLIQSTTSTKTAMPVLKRGGDDRGPVVFGSPSPMLAGVRPVASELLRDMRLGDRLIVTGSNLGDIASITAVFENPKVPKIVKELIPVPSGSPSSLLLDLPTVAALPALVDRPAIADKTNKWAVGIYSLSLRVVRKVEPPPLNNGVPVDPPAWTTNSVFIALAPIISVSPLTAKAGDDLTVICSPGLRPEQLSATRLIFGENEVVPKLPSPDLADLTKSTSLTFVIPAVKAGEYTVRLRVEGIYSLPLPLPESPIKPLKLEVDPAQKVVVKP